MSGYSGFVEAGIVIGVNTVLVKPKRGFYNIIAADNSPLNDIIAMAVIEENHRDDMEITEHPVEIGAPVADHAFKRPAEVTLHLGWSNSPNKDNGLISAAVAAASANNAVIQGITNVAAIASGIISLGKTVQSALNGTATSQMIDIYNKLLKMQSSRALFDLYTGKRVYQNMFAKSITAPTDYKTENALFVTIHCQQLIIVSTQTVQLPKTTQKDPAATASPVNNGQANAIPASSIPLPAAAGQASSGSWK